MTTENEDWKPRNYHNNDDANHEGNYGNSQNRERRPYQSYNRENYGNSQGGNHRNSQGNNYRNNQGGNYGNSRGGRYGNSQGGDGDGYNRHQGGNSYNRQEGNNYGPQRPNYDRNYARPSYSSDSRQESHEVSGENGLIKKRRPRVGDASASPQNTNYSNRHENTYDQGFGGNYQRRDNNYRPKQSRNGNRYPNQNNRSNYDPNSKYSLRKQMKYREENFDPNEPIRLNKYLANAGVCSRREADEFIAAGVVKVNGEVVNELGTKVKRADEVRFHDNPVTLEHKIYVLLNKPKNCVTTADDPQERLTVMDLVKNACEERIFPVGRLDRNTTGVLLLTNDGDLASKLTHPKFLKKKIYHVWLDKDVSIDDMQKIADGVDLEDGEIHADAISYVTDTDKDQVGIEIHSGRNRIVRRMFEALGYHVMKLDRVYFAGLTKKNLRKGQWRFLNEKEVSMLRMGAFE